ISYGLQVFNFTLVLLSLLVTFVISTILYVFV
ncbi:ABC transporter permease, partial [Bacillus cereus]|nr:ABC transporter permease [Bacillus cereus]